MHKFSTTGALATIILLGASVMAFSGCKKAASDTAPNGGGTTGGDTTALADKVHFGHWLNCRPTMYAADNSFNLKFADFNWYNNALFIYYTTTVGVNGSADLEGGTILKLAGNTVSEITRSAPGKFSRFTYLKNDKAFSVKFERGAINSLVKFYTNSTSYLDKAADYPNEIYQGAYGRATGLYGNVFDYHYLVYESTGSFYQKGVGLASAYYLTSWYAPKYFTNPSDSIFGGLGEMAIIGDNAANMLVAYQLHRVDAPTISGQPIGDYLRITSAVDGDFAKVADFKDTLAANVVELKLFPTAVRSAALVAHVKTKAGKHKIWHMQIDNFNTISKNAVYDLPDVDPTYDVHISASADRILVGMSDLSQGSKPSLLQIITATGATSWVGNRGFGLYKGSCYASYLNGKTFLAYPGLVGTTPVWAVAQAL